MTSITRLKFQTAALAGLAAWNFVAPILSHGHQFGAVMSANTAAFFVLAWNNLRTIRREQERDKASRWD